MSDTIRVASTAPFPIRLTEPHPNPDRPGDSPALKSVVINGINGPNRGVTENVDAKLFDDWMKANESDPIVQNGLFRKLDDEEEVGDDIEYGFEPALERVIKEDEGAAGEGSAEEEKPAHEVDMNAHSDVPNDDSPRSQTETGPAVVAPARAPEPDLAETRTSTPAARPAGAPDATETHPLETRERVPTAAPAGGSTPIGSDVKKG